MKSMIVLAVLNNWDMEVSVVHCAYPGDQVCYIEGDSRL